MWCLGKRFEACLAASLALLGSVFSMGTTDKCHAAMSTTESDKSLNLRHNGVFRTYWLHIPPSYDGRKPVPLVVALHGMGGAGSMLANKSGLSAKADKEGFIAVYPDALGTPSQWNHMSGAMPEPIDDIGFLRALISSLQSRYLIDAKRIYVTGHSSGGMMAHRAGADLSDLVAAIAPVAGSVGVELTDGRQVTIPRPKRPLPVLIIHGKLDEVVPYDGRSTEAERPWTFFSVHKSALFWVKNNGCNSVPYNIAEADGRLQKETYGKCQQGTEIVVSTLKEGNHAWPGSPSSNVKISATDLIWDFFSRHPKSERVSLLSSIWKRLSGR